MSRDKGMRVWSNERGGADTLLVTLFVVPLLLFVSFAGVPVFVYIMKANHLNVTANHALKEAEAIGYVSSTIMDATRQRLEELGLEPVTRGGVTYPSFEGSTVAKMFRDDTNSTVTLVITYPAPDVLRIARLFGGSASGDPGLYRVELHGKSEAYE